MALSSGLAANSSPSRAAGRHGKRRTGSSSHTLVWHNNAWHHVPIPSTQPSVLHERRTRPSKAREQQRLKKRLARSCHDAKEVTNPCKMSFPFCLIALGVATPALAAPPSPASSLGRASDSQTPAAGRSNLHLLLLAAAFPQSAMTFKSFQARSPVSSKARHKVIFISHNFFFLFFFFVRIQ